ncbi:MAG: integrin, partial [Haliea sp.]
DYDGVRVQCAGSAVRIGGTVQGLSGAVALQLNGGESLQVTANGTFTFATPLAAGAPYEITIQTQPSGQTCTLAGARGVAGAGGEALRVACTAGNGNPPPPPPPAAPPPVPSAPAQLTLTYGPKTLVFAWSATASATAYQLQEDPDGAGPLPFAALGSPVFATTRTHLVPQLLTSRLNAQYAVQACNASGCSAASPAVVPDWARAIGYFKSSNPGTNHFLGSVNTVSLSADGSTMALGAYGEASDGSGPANTSAPDAGAVYIYARGPAGWVQQAYLKAPVPEAGDFFGKALALSADGNTLAVSADGEDSSHTGTFAVTPAHNNGNTESGAAYIYTRSGGSWSPQAFIKASNAGTFDLFGFSLALSGDGNTLAVGAYLEDSPARGINGATGDDPAGSDSGAAYIFTRSGTTWSQQAFIKASNADANDWFGFKVALSFNGDALAVSGWSETSGSQATPADNSVLNAGAVYVFARTGVSWTEQAYLKSTLPEVDDRFGNALALSSDGNTLAVAAQGDDSNHTGTFAATPADNNLAANSGAVYLFTRSGAAWSQQAFVKASNTRAVDRFGHQLSLAGNGNLLAVGAYQEDSSSRGFGGNQADAGATNAGAAYLFSRTGANWTQQAYLKAPNADAGDRFGIGIALSRDGTSLAIAADSEDSSATGVQGNTADNSISGAGATYLY